MGMVFYNSFTKYYKIITSQVEGYASHHPLGIKKTASGRKSFSLFAQCQTIREMIQRTRAVKRAAARKAITFW